MKEVFEAFLGIFFLMLMMVTGVSLISASIDAKNVDANISAYVAEMEESNFSKSIIETVWDDAETRGYGVHMVLYYEDYTGTMNSREISSKNEIGTTTDVYMAQIVIDFNYSFALYNNITRHTLYRFAR